MYYIFIWPIEAVSGSVWNLISINWAIMAGSNVHNFGDIHILRPLVEMKSVELRFDFLHGGSETGKRKLKNIHKKRLIMFR